MTEVWRADYVIVGGGVYGTAVGWELSKRGAGVLVLEAQPDVAAGASGGIGRRGIHHGKRDRGEPRGGDRRVSRARGSKD